jgi:SpoVK/Ycf46/Vps4 family AAA+-type ATPase
VHLRKRNREPEEFDLDELAEATEGYSGAEIEAAVKAGLLRAFMDGERWLVTEDIVECAGRIQPTSVIKREQVESLRNWAKDHMAVDAGGIGATPIGERMNGARALEM